MADLTHETIEKWMKDQPVDVLARLPDCTETREAARHVDIANDLAHRALEKVEASDARRQS